MPLAALVPLLALAGAPAAASEPALIGFAPDRVAAERELEARFDSSLDRDHLREWMRRIAARPHHLGSPYGREVAEFLASEFRSWGYDTRIEEFEVLFPTPKSRLVELIAPHHFKASLSEPPLREDATSSQTAEQLPVYNAYSPDGDVTGELVYVNYGVPEDYEELARRGIDVAGKIVIARYGHSWRGIKPKVAAEKGAIGCLLYSDPRDDGYYEGDVYPQGAWRSARGAQRGSVADMPLYPGDPLTPGIGATKEATRLDRTKAPTIAKIPVIPLSYADAQPLLAALEGPVAPEAFRGALPITYHLGPGPAQVHLAVSFDWKLVPARDVIARLPGAVSPDQWIIRGNHHDAWVNGADDPVSGLVALMEEARAVAELHKAGWTPRRTIVYAAWDGEEPGLLGSTEWAEAHADLLEDKAAVYVNSDSNGRGFLRAAGSHTLESFVDQVARDVSDPETKLSVEERERARRIVRGRLEQRRAAEAGGELRIAALGSGSDYTPFLQHLGIASLNLGYGGEDRGGSYHSIYDSFDHYTRFGDPGFEYGIALARTAGRVVLRAADADVLPIRVAPFADTVARYLDEVRKLTEEMRKHTAEEDRKIRDGLLQAAADPRETYVAPEPKAPVPYLNFAPLENAVARLKQSARRCDEALAARLARQPELAPATQTEVNEALLHLERHLTRAAGLPNRPWFRHQVYAPGFYTGYGVKTLPGVREAIERRDWKAAEQQVGILAGVLNGFSDAVDQVAGILEKAP